jgi:hypothetical protein
MLFITTAILNNLCLMLHKFITVVSRQQLTSTNCTTAIVNSSFIGYVCNFPLDGHAHTIYAIRDVLKNRRILKRRQIGKRDGWYVHAECLET